METENKTLSEVRRVTLVGMVLNVLLAVLKGVVGVLFKSQALVADGVHSLSDLVTDIAVLLGVRYWSAPADEEHPYGHGKIEALVSLFIAVALVIVSYELGETAVRSLLRGKCEVPGLPAFFLALFSIASKEWLFRWTRRVARTVRSTALEANAWHHRSDAFSSVPVAVSVSVAFLFPALAWVDAAGAVLLAFFVLHAAWEIGKPAVQELIDAGIDDKASAIAAVAAAVPGVLAVHKVRARRYGGAFSADLHVHVGANLTVTDGHDIGHAVHDALLGADLSVADVVVHVEPAEPPASGETAGRGTKDLKTALVVVLAVCLAAPCLAGAPKFQWVNVGSNTGLFGYDWKSAGVDGLNLAGSPQSMRRSIAKLKEHRAEIADGATVIIPLCLFTSVVPDAYNARPSATAHPLLAFDGTPSVGTMTSSRDDLVNGWKREFAIRDFDDPMTDANRANYGKMVAFARDSVAWCRAEKLVPVFVFTPAASCLARVFSDAFFRAYVLDFVRDVGGDVTFLNYWNDPAFADDALFANALCLNRTGAKKLTARTIADLRASPRPDGADAWMPDAGAFRRELRAFYPDECHQHCKDPRQTNSVAAVGRDLDAWAAAHPGFDALDVRREAYLLIRRHVQPFLFSTSPFYFELGCNGGWTHNVESVPGRHVNRVCSRFYGELNLIPDAAFALKDERCRQTLALCCGPFVDDMHHMPPFRTILKKGFRGVRDEVAAALAKCPADDPLGKKELETALVGLDTIHEVQLSFARLAMERMKTGCPDRERKNLLRIVESAARCPWEPPRNFYECLNTLWFVREVLGFVDGTDHNALGRPDCWFLDAYRRDLADGTLTEGEARELIAKFLLTAELHHDGFIPVDSYSDHEMEIPMSLGGCDPSRVDAYVPVFNELTELFLDAHLACGCVFPKLHCRISSKSPPAYLEKLGTMLMKGHAVFTLLNDDRYVLQYDRDGFAPEDARDFSASGCWNGYIDSVMDVDGANYLSIVKILEMTIHRDETAMRRARVTLDPLDGATSYEEVREILYRNTIRFLRDVIGEYARYGRANAKVFPHPVYTVCLKGGIESRRDETDAGLPPNARPKMMTLGFLGNVVDSLSSIRRLCFEDRVCTLGELLAAVRSNWKGPRGEELRLRAMAAPSWGDNSPETNGEMAWWMRRISEDTEGMCNDQGGPIRFAIYTYREFMYWGNRTKATPDGRRDGDRLAQGFSPSEYRCRSDVTTVINAIGAFPHDRLYASNANLTFDRSVMDERRLAAILRVYCRKGAHMIQPNCNSVEELLDAQIHPERHQDLVIRVCGFSARFIALSKRWQDEVIARHRLR